MHVAFRIFRYASLMGSNRLNNSPTVFQRLSPDSTRSYMSFAIGLAVFVVGTLATYVAQNADRPISAALVYVPAVTIIGAVNGLRAGLLAGIGASFFYNFFFSEPFLNFKEGHGLGLSIASGFAQAFGGEISAHSPLEMGKGTKIIIKLPALACPSESIGK